MLSLLVEQPLEALDLKMKINNDLLREIESDLSLNVPYFKGKENPIHNCWHFCTDGNFVDRIFTDKDDFIKGMNRIFVTIKKYRIVILAFCLMDTHVHFILYGHFNECNRFIHNYLRLTSMHISQRFGEKKKLLRLPVSHQYIDSEFYLKTAICYVIKNAPVGGIANNCYDYPWGSGALYFRDSGNWCSPAWKNPHTAGFVSFGDLHILQKRELLCSREIDFPDETLIMNGMVFPGEYTAHSIVERIFRTHKSFNFFLCRSKEEDIESKEGILSRLSIPIQEMRQHRNEICQELFQSKTIRTLDIQQRIKLARTLRSRFNSSAKQICRLCGLVHNEVKDMF